MYYFLCLLVIFILSNYIDDDNKIYKIFKVFVWAGVAVVINIFYYYGLELFELTINSTGISSTAFRIGGNIGNSNQIGMFCVFSTVFSVYLLMQHKVKYRFTYIIISIICATIGLLTGSKKALLILVLGILGLALFRKGRILIKTKSILFVCTFLVVFYFAIIYIPVFDTIQLRMENLIHGFMGNITESDDYLRIYMIKKSLEKFILNPVFGNGVYASSYYLGTYSHNNYTEILVNTGMLGFLAFYWPYYIYVRKMLKGQRRASDLKAIAYTSFLLLLVLGNAMVYYFDLYFQMIMVLVSIAFERKIGIGYNFMDEKEKRPIN